MKTIINDLRTFAAQPRRYLSLLVLAFVACSGSSSQGPAGPQGPVGPAGPQGPTGATGPAGSAGSAGLGALVVKDSNGTQIGFYAFGQTFINNGREFVLIKTPAGTYVAVGINGAQFGGQYTTLEYATTNCTGQAYVDDQNVDGTAPPVIPIAVVIGTTAYIPVSTTSTVAVQSQFTNAFSNGGPPSCVANSFTATAFAVSSTMDLSVFVPPFSVH